MEVIVVAAAYVRIAVVVAAVVISAVAYDDAVVECKTHLEMKQKLFKKRSTERQRYVTGC